MVFDPSKAIKKMLGPGVNVPRFRQGRNARDTDGDGINDIMDCQPKNMFRQDKLAFNLEMPGDTELQVHGGKFWGASTYREKEIRNYLLKNKPGYILKSITKQNILSRDRERDKVTVRFEIEADKRQRPYAERKAFARSDDELEVKDRNFLNKLPAPGKGWSRNLIITKENRKANRMYYEYPAKNIDVEVYHSGGYGKVAITKNGNRVDMNESEWRFLKKFNKGNPNFPNLYNGAQWYSQGATMSLILRMFNNFK